MNKKCLIAAIDENFGIGKNGILPWRIPEDFKWFKELTNKSICIMGYNTYKELADKFDYHNTGKLLPNRLSCVITSKSIPIGNNVISFTSISDCLVNLKNDERDKFFIGGAGIFEEALYLIDEIYLTCVHGNFNCDTFFPRDALEAQKFSLNLVKQIPECNFYTGIRNESI